ncbi:hypothetical protein A2U01_0062951 [Trifolium medium]|uniref:Uncharacterized protein n=1 Tax=Trifolium medium TaxID=97028 RepID=A0A392RZY7_9FABA|nr:hypothetical protein [Trifolium medium]
MSQIIDGNSFAFAGEVWESERLLDDLLIVIGGSNIGIGDDVDIMRREEVEALNKVVRHFIVECSGGGWWWGPQEEHNRKQKKNPKRRRRDRGRHFQF